VSYVLGEEVDRPPYWLYWVPWGTTWRRWQEEVCSGRSAAAASFPQNGTVTAGLDTDFRSSFDPDVPPMGLPVNLGPCPRIEEVVLEENEEFIVRVDSWGITRRDFKGRESMADFIDFPVKGWDDWDTFKGEHLDPKHPDRLAGPWRDLGAEWMEKGYPIQIGVYPDAGVFGPLRWLMGAEEGLVAIVLRPDLVHDIMDHITTVYLAVFEQVVKEVRIDVIHLWEDMCYRSGPLISPRHWVEFLGPNYRRIEAFAREHDIPVVSVDTDGNPDLITPPMIETGVDLLFPMEVAAGCDVNEWRHRYPTLAMMGGVDKRVLARGPEEIDSELERIRPAVESGRYIPTLDHLIPDDVSWDNYCHYAQELKRLVGKE
jgi:uroporphyrinogen decarboxylase